MMKYENKFIPVTPKTYEVRYVENKEPSKLVQLAGYLGLKTVENCGGQPCSCISKPQSTTAEVVASAIQATATYGGSSIIKTNTDGTVNITYNSGK
jgi:hypothetical protein